MQKTAKGKSVLSRCIPNQEWKWSIKKSKFKSVVRRRIIRRLRASVGEVVATGKRVVRRSPKTHPPLLSLVEIRRKEEGVVEGCISDRSESGILLLLIRT